MSEAEKKISRGRQAGREGEREAGRECVCVWGSRGSRDPRNVSIINILKP